MTTMNGITGMPAPRSKRAPSFDSKHPEFLADFLEDFEDYATHCGLNSVEKSKLVVQYADKETKRFWKSLEGYDQDYDVLKKNILYAYSMDQPRVDRLVKIINKSVDTDIDDEEELCSYFRRFWTVASDLVKNGKISSSDRDRYFWKGLPSSARKAIRRRLEVEDRTLERAQVPTIEDAMRAGRFVFTKAEDDEDDEDDSMRMVVRKQKKRKSKKRKGRRTESTDESESDEESSEQESKNHRGSKSKRAVKSRKAKAESDGVGELILKLHQLDVGHVEYMTTFARLVLLAPALADRMPPPAKWAMGRGSEHANPSFSSHTDHCLLRPAAAALPTPPPDISCYFCTGLGHLLRDCPLSADYVCAGRVIVQQGGYLLHADGTRIERHPRGLKAAVDQKWGGPLMIQSMVRIQPALRTYSGSATNPNASFIWGNRGIAWRVESSGDEAGRLATTEAQVSPDVILEGRVADEQIGERRTVAHGMIHELGSKTNPHTVQRVIDRLLKAQVPNITVGEVLSLAGGLQNLTVETGLVNKSKNDPSCRFEPAFPSQTSENLQQYAGMSLTPSEEVPNALVSSYFSI